jgi:Na+/proline symporter
MLSVVATETSTLTFLSIPGVAYLGGYRGELATAYQLLESRFGLGARRFTSGIFMVTRLLADSVRLFATAIPLALVTGWPYPVSIAVIGVLTVVYTYFGGIKAVGWAGVFSAAADADKLALFDFSFDASVPYTFWAGLFGGAFLSAASHGTDQLIVQRLLTCKDLRASQRALVTSGFAVIVQFALFLAIGLGLWALYGGRTFDRADEIFARFIVEELPPGLTGLLVAGIFAAAMSSLSSSINSLASASAYDFWAPARGLAADDVGTLRVGRAFTLLWSGLLIAGALVFIPLSRGTTAVEVALGVASLVYGGLLGAFALALFAPAARGRDAVIAIAAGVLAMVALWSFGRAYVAWPWYVCIGTLLTFGIGRVSAAFGRRT